MSNTVMAMGTLYHLMLPTNLSICPILQLKKHELREMNQPLQGQRVSQYQSKESNLNLSITTMHSISTILPYTL